LNTANLQLEGLLLAIAAVNRRLVDKGVLTTDDLAQALEEAAQAASDETNRALSHAHSKAILFPIRALAGANTRGTAATFAEEARAVGSDTSGAKA
jgi:hypothetical protein